MINLWSPGAKKSIIAALCITIAVSLSLASSGFFPAFTEDTARALNVSPFDSSILFLSYSKRYIYGCVLQVVHVVDTTGQDQVSYISLFSNTPGNLNVEAEQIKEGFRCGRENRTDFVSFEAKYSCVTKKDAEMGWDKQDIPVLRVINEEESDEGRRVTAVSMDTGGSRRWILGIDMEEIEDFTLRVVEEGEEVMMMIERGEKSSSEGWHQIQFAGGKKAPTRFVLKLYQKKKEEEEEVSDEKKKKMEQRPVLKLRTDFNRITPQVKRVVERLPPFCAMFGKSTSPFTLAFLASLPSTK